MNGWQIENCVTVLATAAAVVGAYAFGAGNNALWGLLILININYTRHKS